MLNLGHYYLGWIYLGHNITPLRHIMIMTRANQEQYFVRAYGAETHDEKWRNVVL